MINSPYSRIEKDLIIPKEKKKPKITLKKIFKGLNGKNGKKSKSY
jgi:hypothetical protein